jgi:replicative DNA helicase
MRRANLFAVTAAATDEDATFFSDSSLVPLPSGRKTSGASVSETAEWAIVGAILADNTFYDHVIGALHGPQDFSSARAVAAFKALSEIINGNHAQFTVASPITLAAIPSVARFCSLNDLEMLVSSSRHLGVDEVINYCKVVREASAQKAIGGVVEKAVEIVGGEYDAVGKSEKILALLESTANVNDLPVRSLGEATEQALSSLAERAEVGATGVLMTTGYEGLDALTAGFHGGQLIVLAARPGVGKTALALSMGMRAAANGHKVVVASLEMRAEELSKRALSMVSGVDSHRIRLGALSAQDWEALAAAGGYLSDLPLSIVDMPGVNLLALSGLARRLHRTGRLDLLIIDYLQIVEVTGGQRGGSREQQIAELSRGLKKLAMQLNIPILVLSQLNRSVETRTNKRPMLSDLRESGAIEQDADVVMFIHREAQNEINHAGKSAATIIVEKQRSGSPGEVAVAFDKGTTSFLDAKEINSNNCYIHNNPTKSALKESQNGR